MFGQFAQFFGDPFPPMDQRHAGWEGPGQSQGRAKYVIYIYFIKTFDKVCTLATLYGQIAWDPELANWTQKHFHGRWWWWRGVFKD